MKFVIITHVVHSKEQNKFYAYEPYVREMNLWIKNVDDVIIVAPLAEKEITTIDANYKSDSIDFRKVPVFNLLTWKSRLKTLFMIPKIISTIFKACREADHIHLRCPGNIGLIGCLVQIFFPGKPKTAKYAGNWDPNSKQPKSYRFQKWLLSNTILTKNIKVLVYGNWKGQSKNIAPFFTASFSENQIEVIKEKKMDQEVRLLYVGAFTKGKQPIISVKTAHELLKLGHNAILEMYGDGDEMTSVKKYIIEHSLEKNIFVFGNQSKEKVIEAYKKSHFLVFISRSEGWPKVVAESMFFSCLPISSDVSCVPYMLDYGRRGSLIQNSVISEIVEEILMYIQKPDVYKEKVENAMKWSQKFTLESFEESIQKVMFNE